MTSMRLFDCLSSDNDPLITFDTSSPSSPRSDLLPKEKIQPLDHNSLVSILWEFLMSWF